MKKKTLNIQTPNKVIELLEKGSKKNREAFVEFLNETDRMTNKKGGTDV